jgi:hypothetical protein
MGLPVGRIAKLHPKMPTGGALAVGASDLAIDEVGLERPRRKPFGDIRPALVEEVAPADQRRPDAGAGEEVAALAAGMLAE